MELDGEVIDAEHLPHENLIVTSSELHLDFFDDRSFERKAVLLKISPLNNTDLSPLLLKICHQGPQVACHSSAIALDLLMVGVGGPSFFFFLQVSSRLPCTQTCLFWGESFGHLFSGGRTGQLFSWTPRDMYSFSVSDSSGLSLVNPVCVCLSLSLSPCPRCE